MTEQVSTVPLSGEGKGAPHDLSLAVWDVPAAVAVGERFAVRVGAKSSAGCALTGRRIDVRDSTGTLLASGELGATPWPGTGALFWADVALAAPPAPGLATLTAAFDAGGMVEPHQDAAAAFNVAVVARPEHLLTVSVASCGRPIDEAHVRLGAHRAMTDAAGRAALKLAKGHYELVVWKAGYDIETKPIEITADASVSVEAVAQAEDNPDAHWTA